MSTSIVLSTFFYNYKIGCADRNHFLFKSFFLIHGGWHTLITNVENILPAEIITYQSTYLSSQQASAWIRTHAPEASVSFSMCFLTR